MIRTTQLTVMPEGGATYDVGTYTITVDDESGGEFLVVEEVQENGTGNIRIDRAGWPELREAIDRMMGELRK